MKEGVQRAAVVDKKFLLCNISVYHRSVPGNIDRQFRVRCVDQGRKPARDGYDRTFEKQCAGQQRTVWLHHKAQAVHSLYAGTFGDYGHRTSGGVRIHMLYRAGSRVPSVGGGHSLRYPRAYTDSSGNTASRHSPDSGLHRTVCMGCQCQQDVVLQKPVQGTLFTVQQADLYTKRTTDSRYRSSCHNRMPIRKLCQS